jgi:hypothetical protein
MKLTTWIEMRSLNLNKDILPPTLYEWTQKQWSEIALIFPKELIWELQEIVENYLRVMWLDSKLYPARVDIGFSQSGNPIIYEVTTWFIDQVWSCLALQESIDENIELEVLSRSPFDASILTSKPYENEYQLMRTYFQKSGRVLSENEGNTVFVYGYPTEEMRTKENFFPSWRWLEAERKFTQTKVLSLIAQGTNFTIPRIFTQKEIPYETLPCENDTRLIFKQDIPKIKWSRNTISFGKGKTTKTRYESWEMFAQEYIAAYRDDENTRFEMKALFMPTPQGTSFLWAYNLIDNAPEDTNFWNMTIPNDGYPQWPVIIL